MLKESSRNKSKQPKPLFILYKGAKIPLEKRVSSTNDMGNTTSTSTHRGMKSDPYLSPLAKISLN